MTISTEESTYDVPNFGPGKTALKYSGGPEIEFEVASCDMYLPPDASVPEPDKFRIVWQMAEQRNLNHELVRITILPNSDHKGRYLVAFPNPIPLVGPEGSASFLRLMSEDTFRLCAETKGYSSSLRFHFRPRPDSVNLGDSRSSLGESLARSQKYASNDVAFVFPSTLDATTPRVLWTRSSLLRAASPYFESMLESEGFMESEQFPAPTITLGKSVESESTKQGVPTDKTSGEDRDKVLSRRTEVENETVFESSAELDHEDSDFEDDLYPSPSPSPPIRRIEVTQVAYKTLLSFLHYLETGSIHFSTLSSLLHNVPLSSSSFALRPKDYPPTCSPKSMYLLSHLYEHSTLRQLSFESISSQLGSNNALAEFFSDLSLAYPEIKALTLKAVLENWEIVKGSKEMNKVQQDLEQGKLEKSKVGLLFELLSKLKPV